MKLSNLNKKIVSFILILSITFLATNIKFFLKNKKTAIASNNISKNSYGMSHILGEVAQQVLKKIPQKYRKRLNIMSVYPSKIISRKKGVKSFNYIYKKYPILHVISSNPKNALPEFIFFDIHPYVQKFYLDLYGSTYNSLIKEFSDEHMKIINEIKMSKQ